MGGGGGPIYRAPPPGMGRGPPPMGRPPMGLPPPIQGPPPMHGGPPQRGPPPIHHGPPPMVLGPPPLGPPRGGPGMPPTGPPPIAGAHVNPAFFPPGAPGPVVPYHEVTLRTLHTAHRTPHSVRRTLHTSH